MKGNIQAPGLNWLHLRCQKNGESLRWTPELELYVMALLFERALIVWTVEVAAGFSQKGMGVLLTCQLRIGSEWARGTYGRKGSAISLNGSYSCLNTPSSAPLDVSKHLSSGILKAI